MTPFYQDDYITIYHGDCEIILPGLVGVRSIVSDPPYGIGHRRGKAGNRGKGITLGTAGIIGDEKPFTPALLIGYRNVLIWGANWYSEKLPPGRWLIWDKQENGGSGDFSEAEIAWQNTGQAIKFFRHMWLGVQRRSQVGDARLHPMEKPVALMRWCIQQIKDPGLICDPYIGSGSTLVAAKELGLKAIGIEIVKDYCEVAAKRCANTSPMLPLLRQPNKAIQAELLPLGGNDGSKQTK